MRSGLPNLRVLRLGREWTQQQLADKAGLTQATISDLESGKQQMATFETLRSLAKALGVEIGKLFERPT